MTEIGLSHGDAIRFHKSGPEWCQTATNSNRKRTATSSNDQVPFDQRSCQANIRFKKQYLPVGSGAELKWGYELVPGSLPPNADYQWLYYNETEKRLVPVPDGLVPSLEAEMDTHGSPIEFPS